MRGIVAITIFLLMAVSVSANIAIEHWTIEEDSLYDEFASNNVGLEITDVPSDYDIKVVFTIPELGVRESRGPYYPDELRHTSLQNTLWLPLDADYGEYVVRMTITDSEGNKRIKHRFLDIDQP